MRAVSVVLWICSGVCALFSAAFLIVGLLAAPDALKQAAVGALGSAWAIVPYVIARSWDEVTRRR